MQYSKREAFLSIDETPELSPAPARRFVQLVKRAPTAVAARKKNRRWGIDMITVNLYYTGANGAARAFAEEMAASGVAAAVRAEDGNLRYEYFFPMDDPETVLLIDQWRDQEAIDAHHASPMMAQIAALREKYDLHMKAERFLSDESGLPEKDMQYIKP